MAPAADEALRRRIALLFSSHLRLTGRPLLPDPRMHADPVGALWEAPRAVVAHGTERDPVFFYGNRLALTLFEMRFVDFTRLPSRLSAAAPQRAERRRLLDEVARRGFIDDYCGVRISASGRRFRIEQATVWNLVDDAGRVHGQAAAFSRWSPHC